MNQPRSINSTKPFVTTAREYVDKSWDVLPLPRRQKEHPPTGFTGRAGKFADEDDLAKWLYDPKYSEGNIALRLGQMIVKDGVKYEVIGIDVDAHSGKKGAQELSKLERELGKLPDTWTSSSRNDGVSGIRFYLVPYGYGFRGKASDSIDIVQRVHRYAVIYPSWHPDTKTQYFWYEPGNDPNGANFTLEIPNAKDLPLLTDSWLGHLTAGGMKDSSFGDGHYGIDLDISDKELFAWAAKHFNPGSKCSVIERAVTKHIEKIEDSPSNHDKLINAHHHLLHLCAEGHSGWKDAVDEVNAVWFKDIKAKGKRDASTVAGEMKRSFNGALRKMKAKYDAWKEQGISLFSPECCQASYDAPKPTVNGDKGNGRWIDRVKFERDLDPADYDKNDRSQGQHFYDRVGSEVRYLSDYNAWAIYDGNRWVVDDFALIRELFDRVVVKTTMDRAMQVLRQQVEYLKQAGNTQTDAAYKKMDAKRKRLNIIADVYRNDSKIKAALNCAKSIGEMPMRYTQLNCNPRVLTLPGGKSILLDEPGKPERSAKGYRVIDSEKEHYSTLHTAVDFLVPQKIPEHEINLWKSYLEKFLPDKRYRRDVQKALGYILFGGNDDRRSIWLFGPTSTGKSTMLRVIEETLATYAATFQPNAVLKEQTSNNNPELGNLLFKRAIMSSELGGQRISAEVFKQVSGCDTITVTRKYSNNQISGRPHFVMVIATNKAPNISDLDQATVKRMIVLPFDTQVSSKDDDKRADVILAREARHAVFHWLLEGYKRYIREGLEFNTLHDKIKAATLEFAVESSDIATFLADLVEGASEDVRYELFKDEIPSVETEFLREQWSRVTTDQLYNAHVQDCAKSNRKPMGNAQFGRKVAQIYGIKTKTYKVNGQVVRKYVGLRWLNESAMTQVKG